MIVPPSSREPTAKLRLMVAYRMLLVFGTFCWYWFISPPATPNTHASSRAPNIIVQSKHRRTTSTARTVTHQTPRWSLYSPSSATEKLGRLKRKSWLNNNGGIASVSAEVNRRLWHQSRTSLAQTGRKRTLIVRKHQHPQSRPSSQVVLWRWCCSYWPHALSERVPSEAVQRCANANGKAANRRLNASISN